MTDGGVGRNAGKTVGSSAFQAEAKMRKGRRLATGVLRLHKTEEGLTNGGGQHREFRARPLLLEPKNRFREVRIAPGDFLTKNGDLRMLAAEAQNRRAGNIGMMDVSRDEPAQVSRIFPRSAAAAFVHQELDPIEMLEHSRTHDCASWRFILQHGKPPGRRTRCVTTR